MQAPLFIWSDLNLLPGSFCKGKGVEEASSNAGQWNPSHSYLYCIKNEISPLRVSWQNPSKSAVSYGFGHIYWRHPQWKTSFFAQCWLNHSIFHWALMLLTPLIMLHFWCNISCFVLICLPERNLRKHNQII